MEDEEVAFRKSKGGSSTRAEQAKLASTLLEASKNAPKIQGKIVNDYGQEEVGVSRWQQKQAMVRDMYARNNSTPDMNHEQRVMAMMEARKRARALDPKDERKQMEMQRTAHQSAQHERLVSAEEERQRSMKKMKVYSSSSSSASSSDSESRKREKKKKKKKSKKDKKSKKEKKAKKHRN